VSARAAIGFLTSDEVSGIRFKPRSEGLRMTVEHPRDLMQPRRTTTVAAAVVQPETKLVDVALLMFDKLMAAHEHDADPATPLNRP